LIQTIDKDKISFHSSSITGCGFGLCLLEAGGLNSFISLKTPSNKARLALLDYGISMDTL